MKDNTSCKSTATWMLALIIIIAVLTFFDARFRLIESIWWYDSMLHLMGGAWVGILFIYLFSCRRQFFDGEKNFFYSLAVIVGFTALVGVVWEFYEFAVDATIGAKYMWPLAQPSIADTMKDLANDLLGSVITAAAFFLR